MTSTHWLCPGPLLFRKWCDRREYRLFPASTAMEMLFLIAAGSLHAHDLRACSEIAYTSGFFAKFLGSETFLSRQTHPRPIRDPSATHRRQTHPRPIRDPSATHRRHPATGPRRAATHPRPIGDTLRRAREAATHLRPIGDILRRAGDTSDRSTTVTKVLVGWGGRLPQRLA